MPGVVISASSGMEWAAHLGLPPVRALPPSLVSPCAAPPCPRFVRRDPTIGQTSIFKPPVPQRFNLVVPTSLIERNFDMNSALQCGLKVVFKRLGRGESLPAEALEAAHGCVSRHVNPIGLTSYRVSGAQPAGVGSGCALQGWSVEGGCLVVEVASRQLQQQQQQQHDTQDSAPAPARRLFGDCLPSPATIRKQRPQRDGPEEEPQARLAVPLRQPQLQKAACAPPPVSAPAAATVVPPQPNCAEAPLQAVSASNAVVVTDVRPASCCQMDPSSSLQTSDSSEAQGGLGNVPVCTKLAKSTWHASRAASQSRDIAVPTPPAQRPKRHRRCPTKHSTDLEQPTLHAGIDLLLAAHMALTQQESGRPKRARRPNSLFVQ